jgi:predicted ArsR family transcriptional regulator
MLTLEDVDLLEAIKEVGGLDCSGNCRVRKPGEMHCSTIAGKLGLSPTSVKVRIQDLLRMGLIIRSREDAGRGRIILKFRISPLAERTLEVYHRRLQEEGLSN